MEAHSEVNVENALAKAMLKQAIKNKSIMQLLIEMASVLRAHVLQPMMSALLSTESWSDLSPTQQDFIHTWAIKHSKGDQFLGALLPQFELEELKSSLENRRLLVAAIDNSLAGNNEIKTIHDLITFIKTMDDMGYAYVTGHLAESNQEEYQSISKMIFPSKEELDMRSLRPEKVLATTYGIGTELDADLMLRKEDIVGCFPGKAKFIVPLSIGKNSSQTWFEKLAFNKKTSTSLPLIASASSSTARLLITLQHLGAFTGVDKQFDVDKAQIFANCLMGYFVYCGHHSVVEVMEIWNRYLDDVVLRHPEQLPSTLFPNTPSTIAYFDDPEAVERKLPYGKIGDHTSFLHPSCATAVIKQAEIYSATITSWCYKKRNKQGMGIFATHSSMQPESFDKQPINKFP